MFSNISQNKTVTSHIRNCIIATVLTFLLLPVTGFANNEKFEIKVNRKSNDDISQILNKVNKHDPQKPQPQRLVKNLWNSNQLSSEQNNLKINFDLKGKQVKLENNEKGDVVISVPNQEQYDSVDQLNNKIVYTGKKSKTDLVVESIDGGVRHVINIKDSSAPNFYDFSLGLENDEKIVLTQDGGALVQSSKIDVTTKSPKVKLFIAKPWAKDANGKDLKTVYQVNGNILRQIIDFEGAVFPVTADPAWCGSTVSSVSWIYRRPYWSASVIPTWCGRSFDDYSFVEVINKTPYHPEWDWRDRDRSRPTSKYWSMYDQYYCHFNVGTFKYDWNLEPVRPHVGMPRNLLSSCNPI